MMAEAKKKTSSAKSDAKDIEQNKVFAIFSYLGLLVLIPLLAAPDSKFAQFHAKQGLNLLLITLIAYVPLFFIGFIPLIGILAWLASMAVGMTAFVLSILGIVNAANGKEEKLPIIGDMALVK